MSSASKANEDSRPGLGILLRMIAVVSGALIAVVVKLATEAGVHAVEIMFYRFALTVPLISAWAFSRGGVSAISTHRLGGHILRGILGVVAMLAMFHTVATLPLAEATTILFTAPLIATFLSIVLLREAVGVHRWLAIGLGAAGMIVMIRPGDAGINILGVAFGLTAASLNALLTIAIRKLVAAETPTVLLFWFTIVGTVASAAAMPFYFQFHDWWGWVLIGCACLVGNAGQIAVTSALRYASVSVLAPFEYSQLLWATLFGWLIWSDLPSTTTIIGAALIGGAGLYTLYREHWRRSSGVAKGTLVP